MGDRITGPAGSATLNQWQNVRLTRKDGVCSLYVNGVLLGTATDFQTPSEDFTIAAAKTGAGTPDGGFIGLLDNVRLATGSSGYGNAILNRLPAGASNQDMQPDADFDGDGAPNALEYLFGTGMASNTSQPTTFFTMDRQPDGDYPAIIIPLGASERNEIYWEVQSSPDLSAWEVIERQPTYVGPSAEPVIVRDPRPLDSLSRMFLRLAMPGGGFAAP